MRNLYFIHLLLVSILLSIPSAAQQVKNETFGEVVIKLKKAIDDLTVLTNGACSIAVSPSYQGRVFTSTTSGDEGKSIGWINWKLINDGQHNNAFAYLGGESRFWLAPEFGKFSVFFDPGAAMIIKNMRAPKDLDSKKFNLSTIDTHSLVSKGTIQVQNANGYVFNCGVERKITLLTKPQVVSALKITLPKTVNYVAFSAATTISNMGTEVWNKENGLLSIWELGCMLTTPKNKVIIPIIKETDAITSYFFQKRLKMKS
ncbi:DUF6786 family protein [Aquimarina agarivorans]|uniref:DUF6786 family protein n=1 Tax=Aquimarina agarivorans TaxID=980584 RepID=UPI00030D2C81|nr:DUF6786 family protein [Aquimarina agarivorans]